MKDILKIVKSTEKSCLLIEDVSETIQKEAKELKCRFLCMFSGSLAPNLVANMFPSTAKISEHAVILADKKTITIGLDFEGSLIL